MSHSLNEAKFWQQWLLIGLGLAVVALVLLVPLVLIFTRALSGGWDLLVQNLSEDYMQHALMLTVLVAIATVPINLVFGICLAWCVTRYDFRGRRLLSTLIDIPYPSQTLVHVHSDAGELGRVYRPDLAINADSTSFVEALATLAPSGEPAWTGRAEAMHKAYLGWSTPPANKSRGASHPRVAARGRLAGRPTDASSRSCPGARAMSTPGSTSCRSTAARRS